MEEASPGFLIKKNDMNMTAKRAMARFAIKEATEPIIEENISTLMSF